MKIDRLLGIVMVLLNREKLSAPKLAKIFEVSTRTIYRDIEAISMAGIPVLAEMGVKGGISIVPQYKVDKSIFTEQDISTLLLGLETVSPTFSSKDITGTLEKIKNLLPKNQAGKLEMKASQISIDLSDWKGSASLEPKLREIKEALGQNRRLSFRYTTYRSGKRDSSQRHIEPYQLVLKEGHWYLQGYCTDKEDFRIFKISRIHELKAESGSFISRDFSPKSMGGIQWVKDRLIRITLLADPSLREELEAYGKEEDIIMNPQGKLLAEISFTEDEHGYRRLLSFGDKCQCLSPPRVRNELKRRIRRMMKEYE